MKKRAADDKLAAEVQRVKAEIEVQTEVQQAVVVVGSSTSRDEHCRRKPEGARVRVELPAGLRTAPHSRAAVTLPNNAARVSYRDLEQSIVNFDGEEST